MEKKTVRINRRRRKINDGDLSHSTKGCKMRKLPLRLCETFFNIPSYILAQNLLGKILIRKVDSVTCKGRIVETECYPGSDDKASCTFNGRRTPANEALYMSPGTAFVYMTYGMYYCINISASEPGAGVLIRALEPIDGIDHMRKWRIDKTKTKKDIKTENLCNGPSKFCTSFQITKTECNMLDLSESKSMLWVEDDPDYKVEKIVHTTRIGINSAGKESAAKLYRFYIFGNSYVSKRDLLKEEEIEEQATTA